MSGVTLAETNVVEVDAIDESVELAIVEPLSHLTGKYVFCQLATLSSSLGQSGKPLEDRDKTTKITFLFIKTQNKKKTTYLLPILCNTAKPLSAVPEMPMPKLKAVVANARKRPMYE